MNVVKLDYTITEAADYLGVSSSSIRVWTDTGRMPHYRTPGGQRRFTKAQLDEFTSGMLTSKKKTKRTAPVS